MNKFIGGVIALILLTSSSNFYAIPLTSISALGDDLQLITSGATAVAHFDAVANTLEIEIRIEGLEIENSLGSTAISADDIDGVHFHLASKKNDEPIVFGIFGPQQDHNSKNLIEMKPDGSLTIRNIWDIADINHSEVDLSRRLAHLDTLKLFLDVRSKSNPGGTIRSQLVPEPSTVILFALGIGSLLLGFRHKFY